MFHFCGRAINNGMKNQWCDFVNSYHTLDFLQLSQLTVIVLLEQSASLASIGKNAVVSSAVQNLDFSLFPSLSYPFSERLQ